MQRSCIVDVPSMEGLGRCAMTLMSLTSLAAVLTMSIAPPSFVEKLVRCPKRGNAANSLTDCPAQHGGAERQQLTDIAACPKREGAWRHYRETSQGTTVLVNAPDWTLSSTSC